MAHLLAYSSVGLVPAPTTTVVWRAAVGKLIRLGLLATLMTTAATGVFGFVSPASFIEGGDPIGLVIVVLASATMVSLGMGVFPSVLGVVFGRFVVPHRNELPPEEALSISRAFYFSGVAVGLLIAAVGRALDRDPLYAAVAIVLLALVVYGLARVCPQAVTAWRGLQAERARQAAILAHGVHSVGRLTSVHWLKRWVEYKRPAFRVTLAYEYRGEEHTVSFDLVDYPLWAPTKGAEFDVWVGPGRPTDSRNIMIRRRYVGQRFVDDPEKYRDSGTGDSPPGPIGPVWLFDRPDNDDKVSSKVSPAFRFMLALPPVLVAFGATTAAILAPIQVADMAEDSWVFLLLWLFAGANLYNAVLYLLYLGRSRWLIRTGLGLTLPTIVAAVTAFGGAWALGWPSAFAPGWDGTPWKGVHNVLLAAVIGGLLMFAWTFVALDKAERHINGRTPAPAEVVQEALTSPDPAALDELERRYGYRAGAFLCKR